MVGTENDLALKSGRLSLALFNNVKCVTNLQNKSSWFNLKEEWRVQCLVK